MFLIVNFSVTGSGLTGFRIGGFSTGTTGFGAAFGLIFCGTGAGLPPGGATRGPVAPRAPLPSLGIRSSWRPFAPAASWNFS